MIFTFWLRKAKMNSAALLSEVGLCVCNLHVKMRGNKQFSLKSRYNHFITINTEELGLFRESFIKSNLKCIIFLAHHSETLWMCQMTTLDNFSTLLVVIRSGFSKSYRELAIEGICWDTQSFPKLPVLMDVLCVFLEHFFCFMIVLSSTYGWKNNG